MDTHAGPRRSAGVRAHLSRERQAGQRADRGQGERPGRAPVVEGVRVTAAFGGEPPDRDSRRRQPSQRREDSGVVKDVMGTDLSAGTSFELGDLDLSAAHTEASLPRLSPPEFKGAPRADGKPEPPKGGSTAEIAKPSKTSAGRRRSSGFWLGVTLALGAVVGFHYLSGWAQKKGVMRVLGLSNDAAVERTPTVSAPGAPAISQSATLPFSARTTPGRTARKGT